MQDRKKRSKRVKERGEKENEKKRNQGNERMKKNGKILIPSKFGETFTSFVSLYYLVSGERFKSWHIEGVLDYLKTVGHVVSASGNSRADVNVAQNYHNVLRAHSDSRRGGSGSALY